MTHKTYIQYLTEEDRAHVSFKKERGRILEFSVNYSAKINGRWKEIFRVDNCHGQPPHMHRYYVHRKQFRLELGSNPEDAFTSAKKYIVSDFEKIKQNHLLVRRPRRI